MTECSCGDECRWELRSGPALDLELARQREELDALEAAASWASPDGAEQ